jgi:putative nucleotidyltransferase with HDIG domain
VARERRFLLENLTLQQAQQHLVNSLCAVLKSLVNSLESRDPYLEKHSERVTGYAVGMAESLRCTPVQVESLLTTGYLHDLGKISVADSILNKPGALSIDEYEVIKRHPAIGESMVSELGLSEEQRAIIRHHHERWDGNGYPGGLAQGQIPLLARIVAVADAFASMTSERAYRGAMGESAAIQELLDNAGKQFDPEVVEVFVASRRRSAEGPGTFR